MNRLVLLATLLLLATTTAPAQDDYKKYEFFGGYSAMHVDNLAGDTGNAAVDDILGDKQTLRGFNLEFGRNFHKYVGAMFDYSFHTREDNFNRPAGSGNVDSTIQNILGGIQIKNNMEDGPTFKPFGHALFGVAVEKVDIDSPNLPALFGINDFHTNETSFAMAFGGGVDIKLNHRFDIRAIQIDWNIINRGDQQTGIVLAPTPFQTVGSPFVIPGTRQDNLRIGAGIVIH